MKKYLVSVLALMMMLGLVACGAAGGGEKVAVTFSTGETYEATVGKDFEFYWQCDAPGDMGEPAAGEEGAGITVSDGTVKYSDVSLGGPSSYPTSEKVIISGFKGDIQIDVCANATDNGATHTIYTTPEDIQKAIETAAAMAASRPPMEPGASGDAGAPPAMP